MIDIEKIKETPDDKPRKGPARMSKSVKCEARALYKRRQRRERNWRRLVRKVVPPHILTAMLARRSSKI